MNSGPAIGSLFWNRRAFWLGFVLTVLEWPLLAQPYGQPERGEPRDSMIQEYLRRETAKIETDWNIGTLDDWKLDRENWMQEYYHMLGLWPEPAKTPPHATVTGKLERDDYVIEKLHYQSRPGLYVTANLYRPAKIATGERLPAILYVCGHSSRGRNGNKTAFQSHGIWFARHGYVCLMVDTLQLGEIAGVHHGTYRENRWWWLSRGYTPAGVECWNGVRAIDYLTSRTDVDPDRIGVTGISGGGAATFWIAAADERVKVAVPVSGMADLASYVPNRVINGHCDCMFLYNTYQWPWTRIAALIAPRPMLFVNSDKDSIFPMDANERVINRLERVYSLFGASDRVDSFVSIGGHDYREDIRKAVYRFLNTYLKGDSRPVEDSEVDLVRGPRESIHPIAPEELRVFPSDQDIPSDALNGKIDEHFVPMAKVEVPARNQFTSWRDKLLGELREVSFRHLGEKPESIFATEDNGITRVTTESGITNELRLVNSSVPGQRIVLWLKSTEQAAPAPDWLKERTRDGDLVYACEVRGTGASRWTRKSPPNYVERSHYLLGQTVDSGRVLDVIAVGAYLRKAHENMPVFVAAEGGLAVVAAYAAAINEDIAGLLLNKVPASLMESNAPAILNALRVCDVPEMLGCVAPRPTTLVGCDAERFAKTAQIYEAAGERNRLSLR
jgi:dienelactone hydrolase